MYMCIVCREYKKNTKIQVGHVVYIFNKDDSKHLQVFFVNTFPNHPYPPIDSTTTNLRALVL